jgi:hypothetical protein
VILTPTNTSRTVRTQSEKVLETAARLLRGESDYCAHALPGMCYGRAAVDQIANLAHRTPWCWQCDYASRICLRGILQTWWLQLDGLAHYIRYTAEFEPRRRPALDRAAQRVEAVRDALLQWTDYNAIRAACADAEQQARYGEELRSVAPLMESAGRALAEACELKKLDVLHANPVPPWPNAAWVLASRVPFYLEMPDSYDTFMCAVQVLARVVNTVETLTTLRAAAGNSFAILIDTNACALPPSITWDGGGATPLLEALGCSALTYICPTNTADSGVDYVRAAIAATIDKGVPVLAQNLPGYPGWSVILGYTNHARVLLARTPGDQARGLTACQGVPYRTMCVTLGRMPSRRTVLRSVLQRAIELYRTPATNRYACGRAAWEWYRDQVDLYGEMQVTPGPIVEAGSGRIWQWALKARRDAYDYLTGAMVDAPEVAIILGAARSAYVEEANALSLAMADGVVLGAGRRGSTSQWLVDGYLRQIDALNTAMALEAEAVGHLQNALLQLGTPSGLAP